MRVLVAECEIDYRGRLTAHLPSARRLILVKADGTLLVHADAGAKPLNWMQPPCTITEHESGWTVFGSRGETLEIAISAVHYEAALELGQEPGLRKTGSEDELQALLASDPEVIEPGLRLVRREFPTDLGPVDLLCEDVDGRAVLVEVKRVGEIDGVQQLCRYAERVDRDAGLRPVRPMFVAQTIKPQALVYASSRGVECREVDFDVLAGRRRPDLTLF